MALTNISNIEDITLHTRHARQKNALFSNHSAIEIYIEYGVNGEILTQQGEPLIFSRIMNITGGTKSIVETPVPIVDENVIVENIFIDEDAAAFQVRRNTEKYVVLINLESYISGKMFIRRNQTFLGLLHRRLYLQEDRIIARSGIMDLQNFQTFYTFPINPPPNVKLINVDNSPLLVLTGPPPYPTSLRSPESGDLLILENSDITIFPVETGIIVYIPDGVSQLGYLSNGYNSPMEYIHLLDNERNDMRIGPENQIVGVYTINGVISVWLHNLATNMYDEYSYQYRYAHTKSSRSVNY